MSTVHSRRPRIGKPLANSSVVSRVSDPGNNVFVQKYACASCVITYEVPRGRSRQSKCPLCEARHEIKQLREGLRESQDRLERTTNELNRLKPLVDLVAAMRNALEVTGPEDLVFLKSVAYRFREDGTIRLKVLSGRGKGNALVPIGFVVDPMRAVEPESHQCTSIGGIALARYVAESMRSFGRQTTMQHLVRAMSSYLPGGL